MVDARDNFKETVNKIELGLSPQTWIHRCRRITRRIAVGAEIPNNATVGRFDQRVVECSKKAALRVDKIPFIVEWKIHCHRMLMRRSVFGDRHGGPQSSERKRKQMIGP